MRKLTWLFLLAGQIAVGQNRYELNNGWVCAAMGSVKTTGEKISVSSYPVKEWMPATVPGTVLTSLLNNKKVPDPFYGMNNEQIPDIYKTGRDHYTYWFVKDFSRKKPHKAMNRYGYNSGVLTTAAIFSSMEKRLTPNVTMECSFASNITLPVC